MSFCGDDGLLLAQNQVHHPTSTNMQPRPTAMGQNFLVVAACFLQGVGKKGQAVENTVVVDSLCKSDHGRHQQGGCECDETEGIADQVSQNSCLCRPFGFQRQVARPIYPHGFSGRSFLSISMWPWRV